jgi:hypothetical protein
MLDEHLFDGFVFEVGVDGFSAEVGEGGEAFDEDLVCLALRFDECHCSSRDLGNALGEFADGAVPVFLMGLAIFKERTEDVNEFDGIDDFAVELDVSVLDEKGVGGGLEGDVGARVAEREFLFGFDAERVFGVFGFPPGAREVEGVDQAAVNAERAFAGAGDGVFGDEGPIELAGAAFEEVAEGFADVAFVVEFGAAEFGEGVVVGLDGAWLGFKLR